MITVENKRSFKGKGEYIGRPSILGNPFKGERMEVIAKYRIWLWKQIKTEDKILRELDRLRNLAEKGNLVLICWCAPKPCHGDVIKKYLEWMMKGEAK